MKVPKEIRIVALDIYKPEGQLLSERLAVIQEKKLPMSLVLTPNKYDSTCLLAKIGKDEIGLVNQDDKRYVQQLLTNGVAYNCLRFHEVYDKQNEAPILRYVAWIDLEKVEPIEEGKDWKSWNYDFPVIERIADWNSVDYVAGLLERSLMDNENDIETIDELVNDLTNSTLFDISVETTKTYENLTFMLELNSSEQKAEWKHKLQRASTERRSKKTHKEKLPDWWNMCLASPEAKDIRNTFTSITKEKHGITGNVIPSEKYQEERVLLEKQLQQLPYGLYEYINRLDELYHMAFYDNIPRRKLQELLSALILKDWLDKMDETHDKGGNTYYYVGRDFIHNGDNINHGGTKNVKNHNEQ